MLIAETYLPIRTMPLELWRKDMRVIADFANSLACPTPMFSAAVPLFNAAVASGYGDQDTAAVAAVIEAMAGVSPSIKKLQFHPRGHARESNFTSVPMQINPRLPPAATIP